MSLDTTTTNTTSTSNVNPKPAAKKQRKRTLSSAKSTDSSSSSKKVKRKKKRHKTSETSSTSPNTTCTPTRDEHGMLHFADCPEFQPNLTPREIFVLGSFGGTYWRPIHSDVTGEDYENVHMEFPAEWWEGIDDDKLTSAWEKYDVSVNRYRVKSGTTLEYWEEKNWIMAQDPYGWVQWFCHFFTGRRTADDDRQIDRWKKFAGVKGRFRRTLINKIRRQEKEFDDVSVSPVIRQGLQHWAYQLSKHDFDTAY